MGWLRNLRVRNKLMVLTILVLAIVASSIAVMLVFMNRVKVGGPLYHEIATSKDAIADSLQLAAEMSEARADLFALVEATDRQRRGQLSREFSTARERIETGLDALQGLSVDEDTASAIADARRTWEAFAKAATNEVIPLAEAGERQKAITLVQGAQRRRFDRFFMQIQSVVDTLRLRIGDLESQTAIDVEDGIINSLLVALAGVVVMIIVSALFTLSVTRPLHEVMRVARRVADGDLRHVDIKVSGNDEIGQLAVVFESVLERLRGLVQQVTSIATALGETSTELASYSQQHERGASQQLAAVEETQSALSSLARAATTVGERAREVREHSEATLVTNQKSGKTLGTLIGHTRRIAEALDIIRAIANKTDLLALNAALEGTKAGSFGRGFSLVANQMQTLADNVMTTAQDIKQLNEDVRFAGNDSVSDNARANELASQTTTSARQIDLITTQQQTGTAQVAMAMQDVLQVARDFVVASREVLQAADTLTALVAQLHHIIAFFQTEVRSAGETPGEDKAAPRESAAAAELPPPYLGESTDTPQPTDTAA